MSLFFQYTIPGEGIRPVPDLLTSGQHMTILDTEIILFIADGLPGGQHMPVPDAEIVFFPSDRLESGQHMTVFGTEIVPFLSDCLEAGQHMPVLDAEIVFFIIDDLPAGPLVAIAVVIVYFSGGSVPSGDIFSGPFQAKILRNSRGIRLSETFEECLAPELFRIALIGHEGVLHDDGGDVVSLVVKKNTVVITLFAAWITAAFVIAVPGAGAAVGQAASGNAPAENLRKFSGLCADRGVETVILIINPHTVGRLALASSIGIIVQADKKIGIVFPGNKAAGL